MQKVMYNENSNLKYRRLRNNRNVTGGYPNYDYRINLKYFLLPMYSVHRYHL